MSEIIIRGIEMPKNCTECPLTYDGIAGLSSNVCDSIPECYEDKRYEGCPLDELQEHGDLVDKTSLVNSLKLLAAKAREINSFAISGACNAILMDIEELTTIVPSNKEADS